MTNGTRCLLVCVVHVGGSGFMLKGRVELHVSFHMLLQNEQRPCGLSHVLQIGSSDMRMLASAALWHRGTFFRRRATSNASKPHIK